MKFFEILEAAYQYYTTLFHGTGIENVKKIVLDREGLIPFSPRTTSGKGITAVYLTPNIKLAARYSLGGLSNAPLNRTPAILEIKLSGAKRHVSSMRQDPLDHPDTAWGDHYESEGTETIREIENDIKEFVSQIGKRYKFGVPGYFRVHIGDDLPELQGFRLHDYIRTLVSQFSGKLYPQIKNDINRFLNSGIFAPGNEYADSQITITQSGTFQLTPEYWNAQHQNYYNKKIPVSAIKAVWVRKSDFPDAVGQEKTFGAELLPAEVVHKFEFLKKQLENIGDEVGKIIDDYEENDRDYYIEELQRLKKELEDYDDIVHLIDQVIEGLDEEDFDFDPILKELESRGLELSGYLYDDYSPGTNVEIDKTVWVRVEDASLLFR